MKLSRIELLEFKRFASGRVLDHLTPGLNIFVGANEAGKSTVAMALRAAFLERYKTTKVAHFAPDGLPQARPTVRIEFEISGQSYVLSKTFLHRARCELQVGERRYEGEQAEDLLAALIGFEIPQKGQSKPVHAGVPGLLWITQGTSQDVAEPALHAASHLRAALTQLTGALAATDGDKLYERVQTERAQLLDARNAKPKGAYREAEDALAEAIRLHAEEAARQSAWEADVDRFATLRQAHDTELREPPWLPLEQKAAHARTRLAALAHEAEAVERAEQAKTQAQATVTLLADQVARDEADVARLAALGKQHSVALEHVERAEAKVTQARSALDAATEQSTQMQAQLEAARKREAHRALVSRRESVQTDLNALTARLDQAVALMADITRLRATHQALRYSPDDLKALREGTLRAMSLQAKVDAVATRLHYALDPLQTILIDGERIEGEGARLVLKQVDVDIAGVGKLSIAPAADDAAQVSRALDVLLNENSACCRRLGVDTLEAAETRARDFERVARDLEFAQRTQAMHAPEGLESLRQVVQQQAQTLADLSAQVAAQNDLQRSVPTDSQSIEAAVSLAEWQQRADAVQAERDRLRDQWRDANAALETAGAQAKWLAEQHQSRATGEQAEQDKIDRQSRQTRLLEARVEAEARALKAQTARQAFSAQQPELIEQDALRFERSARHAQDAHQARLAQLQQLKGKLEQAGAQGAGEQLGQRAAEVERLTRRRDDIALRAQALSLLYEQLGAQREAVTRQLFAPLAGRLNHYLKLLFPQASIRIGDDLSPHSLERDGVPATLDSLSFGTQEQLGVLTRLAYADVLREAGKPTFIVLDDALVHTDDRRRENMKRALYDAATRHQILMLTCHGDAWRDMGVSLREL